jgi:hypothetical protein
MPERAEIEAEVGWTTFWQFAALPHLERMKRVIAAVDRVRDARGDDDGREERLNLRMRAATMEAMRTGELPDPPAARSPQGEDHEAGIEAGARAIAGEPSCYCPDDWRQPKTETCPAHGTGEWPEDRHRRTAKKVIAAYLARVSPSRDGTVAVEDVRAMRRLLSRAIGGLECDPAADRERIYYEIVENPALERIDHTLAEFDALAGESNEGGNQ